MNRSTNMMVLAFLILGILINSVYVVNDKEHAIVFQFGEAVNPDVKQGLNFKIPIIQNVKKYDARLQNLDEEPDRILTVESKYLLVDSFVIYKITNVLDFYRANNGSFNNLNNIKSKILLQIHDELIFEVPNNEVKNISKIIKDEMTSVTESDLHSFSTPLTVDINIGENWGILH